MPITILRGPAGAGKSQYLEENLQPGEITIDITPLHVALNHPVLRRGPDGKYPIRQPDDLSLNLARIAKRFLVGRAEALGVSGYVTTSDSSPEEIEKIRGWGATGRVVTVDPGEAVVRRRLADSTGEVPDACEDSIVRWYSV